MHLSQALLPLAAAAIANASWRAEKTELERAVAALRAAHPDLVSPAETKGGSLVAAAKNLRAQLRRAFPGNKFSVVCERFAGGDAVRVSWTDGPAIDRVEAIADRYQSGTFDAMTDCSGYVSTAWTEAFGDAKFVTTSRDLSPALRAWAQEPHDYDAQRARYRLLSGLNIKSLKQPDAQ